MGSLLNRDRDARSAELARDGLLSLVSVYDLFAFARGTDEDAPQYRPHHFLINDRHDSPLSALACEKIEDAFHAVRFCKKDEEII